MTQFIEFYHGIKLLNQSMMFPELYLYPNDDESLDAESQDTGSQDTESQNTESQNTESHYTELCDGTRSSVDNVYAYISDYSDDSDNEINIETNDNIKSKIFGYIAMAGLGSLVMVRALSYLQRYIPRVRR